MEMIPDAASTNARTRLRLDTTMPFYDIKECRELIVRAARLGIYEAFMALARLAEPAHRSGLSVEEMNGLLHLWERHVDHPLAGPFAAMCRIRFLGDDVPDRVIAESLHHLRSENYSHGALDALMHISAGSLDFTEIVKEFRALHPGGRPDVAPAGGFADREPGKQHGIWDRFGFLLVAPRDRAVGELLQDAVRDGRDLWNSNLNGADRSRRAFENGRLAMSSFVHADLSHSRWNNAALLGADLRGADLRGADCGGAILSHAHFGGARLEGVSFLGADLGGAHLESLAPDQLDGVIMPDGRKWEEYRTDHLRGIIEKPTDLALVVDRWQERFPATRPMHAVFGWRGPGDVPRELRIRVACWQALHEANLIDAPHVDGGAA